MKYGYHCLFIAVELPCSFGRSEAEINVVVHTFHVSSQVIERVPAAIPGLLLMCYALCLAL